MRSWNRNLAKLSRISIPLHEFSSSSQRYLGRGRGSWRLRLHLPRCDHYFSSCCLRMKISSDCRTKLIQQLSLYHASDPWPNNIHRVIYITCTYTYVHIFIYTFVLVCIYNINQLSHAVYYPLPLEKKVFVATQNLLWHFGSRQWEAVSWNLNFIKQRMLLQTLESGTNSRVRYTAPPNSRVGYTQDLTTILRTRIFKSLYPKETDDQEMIPCIQHELSSLFLRSKRQSRHDQGRDPITNLAGGLPGARVITGLAGTTILPHSHDRYAMSKPGFIDCVSAYTVLQRIGVHTSEVGFLQGL